MALSMLPRVWLAANWPQIRLIDIEMLASQRGPF